MDEIQLLKQLNSINDVSPDVFSVSINLIFAAFVAFLVAKFYEKVGTSLSNRSYLSKNFILLCVTTALIITVIKSSITLSLGLVGALSIVRFRTAIKEPEELGFIFLIIAVGLGFGAGLGLVTSIATLIILGIIYFEKRVKAGDAGNVGNIFLNLEIKDFSAEDFEYIRSVLGNKSVSMKRFEESENTAKIVLSMASLSIRELAIVREKTAQDKRYSMTVVEQVNIY